MEGSNSARWTWIAIVAAAAYVFWDSGRAFNLTDEFWYAQITQEMLQSGDWVTPRFAAEPDFNKPPLYFWLSAPFTLFLSGEAAMRIVPGLSFLGILLSLRRIMTRALGTRAALLAVAVFGLTADHLLHHGYKSGVVDGLLNLEMTLIFALALELRERPGRLRWIGVLLGLTFLTKTAFVVFPAVLVGAHVWRLRRERVIQPTLIAQAGLLALSTAGSWLAVLAASNGTDALAYLLGDQVVSRFLGDQATYAASGRVTGRGESLYVLRHLLTWTQPWCWIAIPALGRLFSLDPDERPGIAVLAALWLGGVIAVFSASAGRWPWYTSSAQVPLAILVAWLLDRWLAGEWNVWTRSLVPLTAASLLLLAVPLAYNPFVRQATCAPLDPGVALQLGIIGVLIWTTLRAAGEGPVTLRMARAQLATLAVLVLARTVLLAPPGLVLPLYANGGRCLYKWPEPAAISVQVLIGVAVLVAALTGILVSRRSVQRGCVSVLLILGATYVLGPTLRHGLQDNERKEIRWMRDAITRGVFDADAGYVVQPSSKYLGVLLFAEFGDGFAIEYDAANARTTIRSRGTPVVAPTATEALKGSRTSLGAPGDPALPSAQ